MYKAGDYVICGQHGVCVVEKEGAVSFLKSEKGRVYYTLHPLYSQGGTIYIPADNEKVVMRKLLTKQEAEELIQSLEEIENLWVDNDNRREHLFKEAIKTCDCRELVKVIKTIYSSKQSRIKAGKKVTASDEKYLNIAEERLYGELAIPLNIDKKDVEQFIIEEIKKNQEVT